MRAGKIDKAKGLFTNAIEIKGDFALAYNARGVAGMLSNDPEDNISTDFTTASNLNPRLADAHANLGTFYILTSSKGAMNAFKRALDINNDFSVAYNGTGAALFGEGRYEEAAQYFDKAMQFPPVSAVAEVNKEVTSVYAAKAVNIANVKRENPGMELKTIIEHYPPSIENQNRKVLPDKPQSFKNDINNFHKLPTDRISQIVGQHGLSTVQSYVASKQQQLQIQIADNQVKNTPSNKINVLTYLSANAAVNARSSMERQSSWSGFLNPSSSLANKNDVTLNSLFRDSATSSGNKEITVNMLDIGINQWKESLTTGDDFTHATYKGLTGKPGQGQILIVMPRVADSFNMTPDAKQKWTNEFHQEINKKINEGVANGIRVFEIQLIQDIGLTGYKTDIRQDLVRDFGDAAYTAIAMKEGDLKREGFSITNNAVCGSNGCKVFTENISAWKPIGISGLYAFDSRASKEPTIEAARTIIENNGIVKLFGTKGDAFAPNYNRAQLAGNYDVLKEIKDAHVPEAHVYWLNKANLIDLTPLPGLSTHVSGMDPKNRFSVKEYLGNGKHTRPTEVMDNRFLPAFHLDSNKSTQIMPDLLKTVIEHKTTTQKLNVLDNLSIDKGKPSTSNILGYYTSTGKSLGDVGAVADLVNKDIPSGASKRALVVSDGTFRDSIQLQQLHQRGFETKLVSPKTDVQHVAGKWGADVIVGIADAIAGINDNNRINDDNRRRGSSSLPFFPGNGGSGIPIEKGSTSTKPYNNDPPDKGGGGASWGWGKQFLAPAIKTDPGMKPGGVNTEEIGNVIADKGNWPVISVFGLFYTPMQEGGK